MSTNLGEMLGEEELEAVIDVRGSLIDAWAELQIFKHCGTDVPPWLAAVLQREGVRRRGGAVSILYRPTARCCNGAGFSSVANSASGVCWLVARVVRCCLRCFCSFCHRRLQPPPILFLPVRLLMLTYGSL